MRVRRAPMLVQACDTQDEELSDLQRRFCALKGERRGSAERRSTGAVVRTPRTMRTPRERSSAASLRADTDADLAKLDGQVASFRRRHDQLVHSNMEKRSELERLEDKLKDLSKETDLESDAQNPTTKEIGTLQLDLEKAVGKYEEAFDIRQTYEHIVSRLKKEGIGFEKKLEAREAAIRAKEAEYEHQLLTSHHANTSKEIARDELARFEAAVSEERKSYERVLGERRSLVAQEEEMNAELERAEKAHREALDTPSARHTPSGNHQEGSTCRAERVISDADIEEEHEKVAAYEAAFREIREATGAADVDEVIQKLLTQEETHKNLLAMTEESKVKIEKLAAAKQAAMERVQLLKYSGAASEEETVATVEQGGELICEKQRLKHERLAKVLVSVKVGVQHVAERLVGVSVEKPTLTLEDDNMVEVLDQCSSKLRVLMQAIRDEEGSLLSHLGEAALDERIAMRSEPLALDHKNTQNNRVREGAESEEVASEEEFEDECEEDVVDRQLLKKQSGSILERATKKQTKKRGRMVESDAVVESAAGETKDRP